MRTNVVGSSTDERFWYHADLVVSREPYRSTGLVPTAINPWAIRARRRISHHSTDWGEWTPRAAGVFLDVFERSESIHDHGDQYERRRECVICVVADSRESAHTRVELVLDHSPYREYEIEELSEDRAGAIASQSVVAGALRQQSVVHPLIGGTYTPHLPECHLPVNSDEKVLGLIRVGLPASALREQLDRAEQYRRQSYDLGRFKVELRLGGATHERLLSIMRSIDANESGSIVGGISYSSEKTDCSLGILIDATRLERMQSLSDRSNASENEVIHWKFPLCDDALSQFCTTAEEVLVADTPGVIGPNPFESTARTPQKVVAE
ncbi:hypothetical protein [Halocatena halophila]|uniref:hypothetical protein n=1 Tax=Halocatena halophila TaxID=2814576 RepID=UPI002ED067C2